MNKLLLILVLIPFGTFTAAAVWHDGLAGIFASIVHSYGSMQIFSSVVMSLSLGMAWMWREAKNTGRNIWPWIAATLVAGSFGPLLYLITRKK